MINVYTYSTRRNKHGKNTSVSFLKKELENLDNTCYICNKDLSYNRSELEHIIPVELGGHIFSLENIKLVCVKCHREKSVIDRMVIKRIKDMKMLTHNISFFSFNEIHNMYKFLFYTIKEARKRYNTWMSGRPSEDYNQIIWKGNIN